jgi:G3E family GTPase
MTLESIEDIIRRVNIYAPIINLPTDQIPLDLLLDTERISLEDKEKMREIEDNHTHSETFSNYIHKSDYPFNHILLSEFFRELPYEIYRVKGFIHL